jgi:hypothetical protein
MALSPFISTVEKHYPTLTDKQYTTGIKISDEQMEALNLHPHDTLPQWNYTIKPILPPMPT